MSVRTALEEPGKPVSTARPAPLERGTGLGIALVAVFRVVALVAQPAAEGHAGRWSIALSTGILLVHAMLYERGAALRARWSPLTWLGAQVITVFAFGLTRPPLLVALALYGALTAYALRLLVRPWSAVLVTGGAIVLFAVSTALASNVYRGASVALVLALIAVVVHAVLGGRRDAVRDASAAIVSGAVDRAHGPGGSPSLLTPREVEVLRLAAKGARNQEIATSLGISERTVKAHLASAYGKLGVETRAAATALATQWGLLS